MQNRLSPQKAPPHFSVALYHQARSWTSREPNGPIPAFSVGLYQHGWSVLWSCTCCHAPIWTGDNRVVIGAMGCPAVSLPAMYAEGYP